MTWVTPPRLASFPAERDQLEYSSRSLVFARDGAQLLRAWGEPSAPWVLGVEEDGSRWRVTAWGASPEAARRAVRQLFSLDHPLEEFYRQVRREPVLRGTDRRFRGLRLPRDASLYEAMVHSIVGQQLSVRAANTIKRRLFDATGAVLSAGGIAIPRVPTPGELIALGRDGLGKVGLSRAKASSILSLAQRTLDGAIDTERFRRGPTERAVLRLDEEPGVGRWTAENALLRGTGRRDLFIAGDLGVRAALDRYAGLPRDAPEETARAWGVRHYPGWGSYATLYLWRRFVADLASAA